MNSLSVGKKLGLMGIIILLLLFILGVITYLKLNNIEDNYSNNVKNSKTTMILMKSVEQGLQVTAALRGTILSEGKDKKALDNYLKATEDFEKLIDSLKQQPLYVKFEIENLYQEFKSATKIILNKISMEEKLTALDNKNSTTKWRPLKAKLIEWQTYNNNYSKELENSFASLLKQSSTISIVLILVIIVITSSLIFVISRYIVNQVRIFKDGLESFFAFLNRETNRCKHIDIKSKDEFGENGNFC